MKVIKPNIMKILFHVPEGYKSMEEFLESVGRMSCVAYFKFPPGWKPTAPPVKYYGGKQRMWQKIVSFSRA